MHLPPVAGAEAVDGCAKLVGTCLKKLGVTGWKMECGERGLAVSWQWAIIGHYPLSPVVGRLWALQCSVGLCASWLSQGWGQQTHFESFNDVIGWR